MCFFYVKTQMHTIFASVVVFSTIAFNSNWKDWSVEYFKIRVLRNPTNWHRDECPKGVKNQDAQD